MRQMMMFPRAAVHRTIMVVDVESFGDPKRTDDNQLAVRDALYKALRQSFAQAGIRWRRRAAYDRGDGALILILPKVPKILVATKLPACLADALAKHNAACPAHEEIRLRMALHAGEVNRDSHGFTGASVNLTFRLIDAPESKAALCDSPGTVALIVSARFYQEVVRQNVAAEHESFREISAEVKETKAAAWVRVLEAGPPASVKHGRRNVQRTLATGTAGVVILTVFTLIGWTVGHTGRTGFIGAPTCSLTVNADNINIRYTPDGPATGNKLSEGDEFTANAIYAASPGGQQWIGGWYSGNPKLIGWVGHDYLEESGSDSCISQLPVKQ
jgi:hypothetical protein